MGGWGMRRFVLGFLLALVLPAFALGQTTTTPQRTRSTFQLPAISGFCGLQPDHAWDKTFLEQQRRLRAGSNIVLLVSAPCKEIEAARNSSAALSNWAIWLMNAPKGQVTRISDTMTREQVVDELVKAMPKLDLSTIASGARDTLKKEGVEGNIKRFGVIDREPNVVYVGMLNEVDGPTGKTEVAAVIGMTMLQRTIVSLNLHAHYSNKGTFDNLLSVVRNTMSVAIVENDKVPGEVQVSAAPAQSTAASQGGSPPEAAASELSSRMDGYEAVKGYDWRGLIGTALGIGLLFGLVLGVFAIWRAASARKS